MIEIITLKNGMRVALEKMEGLRSVSLGIWVKNGSKYESSSENGISHFIEHLLFKGTKNRTAKKIASDIDEIGGHINAFTSKEYTCYYTKTLDTHIDIAIDVLSDMFFNSNFDEEEIKKELKVIIEEIAMYEDSPDDLVSEILHEGVFKDTSLQMPILGTKETISKFTRNTFIEYMKKQYTPENVVVAIAGNFDKDTVVSLIEKHFDHFSNEIYIPKNIESFYTRSSVKRDKDIEQLHLMMAYEGTHTGADNVYDLATVGTYFGSGMSSILFQKVREERGLCYSIYSQNISYNDIGLFTIYSALNGDNLEELIEVVLKEIEILKKSKLDISALSRTKEQLKSSYILGLESSSNRMSAIGRNLLIQNKVYTPTEIIDKIDAITLESVSKVIDEVFKTEKLSYSLVGKINDEKIKGLGF